MLLISCFPTERQLFGTTNLKACPVFNPHLNWLSIKLYRIGLLHIDFCAQLDLNSHLQINFFNERQALFAPLCQYGVSQRALGINTATLMRHKFFLLKIDFFFKLEFEVSLRSGDIRDNLQLVRVRFKKRAYKCIIMLQY